MPLSPPPSGALLPQPVARDMKRSPQSSVIISGNILPPSTPPPPPPSASVPAADPPVELAEQTASAITSGEETNEQEKQEKEAELDAAPEPLSEESPVDKIDAMEGVEQQTEDTPPVVEAEPQASHTVEAEPALSGAEVVQEETLASVEDAPAGEAPELTDTDDKGLESDDDFEDAEEEVFKPTAEEIKERESKREQSERASRLIGQKMLQGWAMLQDPCPNPSCHGVPLLRNREKKEYCVVCENYFQREQDLEYGKYTIVSTDSTTAAPPAEISMSTFPPPPTTLPPPPQIASPPAPPQLPSAAASPITSPARGRNQRDILGKVSSSIILPPAVPMSPSFGTTSQQILGKHTSEDFDVGLFDIDRQLLKLNGN